VAVITDPSEKVPETAAPPSEYNDGAAFAGEAEKLRTRAPLAAPIRNFLNEFFTVFL
jgi:hypothetical protein